MLARTVTLKYRDERFVTVTRAHTMKEATDSGDALFEVAWQLFGRVHAERRVRLLGIYASGFGPAQLGLFAHTREAERDRVRDAVEERFGQGALTRASLLSQPGRADAQPAADRRGSRRLRK